VVIGHDKARLRLRRARNLEALQNYLRLVRSRARDGDTAAMWRELAEGRDTGKSS
jgi:hypothetical protein